MCRQQLPGLDVPPMLDQVPGQDQPCEVGREVLAQRGAFVHDRGDRLVIGRQELEVEPRLRPQEARVAARTRGRVARQRLHCIAQRSEEHTSELQSLMRSTYAVLCLKKKK